MRCLKEAPQRDGKWKGGCQGPREGMGSWYYLGTESVFGKMNEVLEMDVGNGYSALRTLLMPLT